MKIIEEFTGNIHENFQVEVLNGQLMWIFYGISVDEEDKRITHKMPLQMNVIDCMEW